MFIVWSLGVGGWKAWLIDRCSDKDVGDNEHKTPTPCATDRRMYQILALHNQRSQKPCNGLLSMGWQEAAFSPTMCRQATNGAHPMGFSLTEPGTHP